MKTVPTPDEFDEYIGQYVLETARRIEERLSLIVLTGPLGEGMTPVDAGLIAHTAIRGQSVLALLQQTLSERGHAYGENVIFALGEDGIALQLMSKIFRGFWSLNEGLPPSARHDTYLDIAGYAVVALAMEGYREARRQAAIEPSLFTDETDEFDAITEEGDHGDF